MVGQTAHAIDGETEAKTAAGFQQWRLAVLFRHPPDAIHEPQYLQTEKIIIISSSSSNSSTDFGSQQQLSKHPNGLSTYRPGHASAAS